MNYAVASRDAQMDMFLSYCALINAFDSEAGYKITVFNRQLDKHMLEKTIYMPMKNDDNDRYRVECNQLVYGKTAGTHTTSELVS